MSEEQENKPVEPDAPEAGVTPPEPADSGIEDVLDQPEMPMDQQEIEEGKAFAILSWALSIIGLPFFLVPLIMRNNEFSLFHAKQCLMVWLFSIAGSMISVALAAICIGFVLAAIVWILAVVFLIMGLIYAINGQAKPLPMIGQWGVEWFKGISKVS
jgi:uncharacterized membrane protein